MPPRARRQRKTTTNARGRSATNRKRPPPTKSRASEERARRKAVRDQEAEKVRSMCRIRVLPEHLEPERDEDRAADPTEGHKKDDGSVHDLEGHTEGDPCSTGRPVETEDAGPRRLLMEIGPFC
jgi:hypothetical protein